MEGPVLLFPISLSVILSHAFKRQGCSHHESYKEQGIRTADKS